MIDWLIDWLIYNCLYIDRFIMFKRVIKIVKIYDVFWSLTFIAILYYLTMLWLSNARYRRVADQLFDCIVLFPNCSAHSAGHLCVLYLCLSSFHLVLLYRFFELVTVSKDAASHCTVQQYLGDAGGVDFRCWWSVGCSRTGCWRRSRLVAVFAAWSYWYRTRKPTPAQWQRDTYWKPIKKRFGQLASEHWQSVWQRRPAVFDNRPGLFYSSKLRFTVNQTFKKYSLLY